MKSPMRFVIISGVCIGALLSCSALIATKYGAAFRHPFIQNHNQANSALKTQSLANNSSNGIESSNQGSRSATNGLDTPPVPPTGLQLYALNTHYAFQGVDENSAIRNHRSDQITQDNDPINLTNYLFGQKADDQGGSPAGKIFDPQVGGTTPFNQYEGDNPIGYRWPVDLNTGSPSEGGSLEGFAASPPGGTTEPVPEPPTMLLLGISLIALAYAARKKIMD